MSYKEIHVNIPAPAPEPRRRPLRLTPIGWMALIILVGLLASCSLYAARVIRDKTMTLADLPRRTVVVPTATPTRTPTATPTRTPTPAPTATPLGWTLQRDPVTGEEYLSPPPDVEAQIREAFEAVLGCILIEDAPDEAALQYDREAAIAQARQVSLPQVLEDYSIRPKTVGESPWIQLVTLGPDNPVHCQNYDTCTIARAKLGLKGAIVYFDQGTFVARPERDNLTTNAAPYELYIAVVELQDSTWKVSRLQREVLPEPPEPPQL